MHNAISCGVKAPDYDYMECCQMDFNLEKLDALGADTQEGISRIMGNQAGAQGERLRSAFTSYP